MKSDSYTPTIRFDKLVALARMYGPAELNDVDDSRAALDSALHAVERVTCPCIRGEACICDAIAAEFLRLARQFHRQRNENNPAGYRSWTDRWENEGGGTVDRKSRNES